MPSRRSVAASCIVLVQIESSLNVSKLFLGGLSSDQHPAHGGPATDQGASASALFVGVRPLAGT
jgi:hypothetical protein